MKGQILVLGAAGRLGFAAAEAFRDAGWSVKGLVRPGAAWRAPKGIDVIETNDRAVAVKEARGTDIVLHALNAPYPGWAQHALPLAYSAIEAAEQSGATLMFPGNVYNYGAGMPAVLDEDDADAADLAQGQAARTRSSCGCAKPPTAACAPSCCAPATSSGADAARGSTSC